MKKKSFIIGLIKDDLTHYKLVTGLERLNLDVGMYYLHLSDAVFLCMGLDKENVQAFKKYITFKEMVTAIDIEAQPKKLDALARAIYSAFSKGTIK